MRDASGHPVVVETLSSGCCAVCGAEDDKIGDTIRQLLKNSTCPLCASDLDEAVQHDPAEVEAIRHLSEEIAQYEDQAADALAAVQQLRQEADEAEVELLSRQAELDQYRTDNALALAASKSGFESRISRDLTCDGMVAGLS